MILSPQQQAALQSLLQIGRIATSGIRDTLPVLPRTHSLLIGQSGSGKSHLARVIAEELSLPLLSLNVASWVVIGARSEWTTNVVAEWLDGLATGGVLVLDEIDKISSTSSEWTRGIRLEIHDLLDGRLPAAARIPESSLGEASTGEIEARRTFLNAVLRGRVFVVACGAFQGAWETNRHQIGFGSGGAPLLPEPPSRAQIVAQLDPELRQRFRDEIVLLPPMLPADYAAVAAMIAREIPDELQSRWKAQIGKLLKRAADGSLGMRALEEAMLNCLLLAGRGAKPDSAEPLPTPYCPPII